MTKARDQSNWMSYSKSLSVSTLSLIAIAIPSVDVADPTVRQLFDGYDAAKTIETRVQIETLVARMGDGLVTANMRLQLLNRPQLFCIPQSLQLTGGQIVSMMQGAVRERTDLKELPATVVILYILERTFPCSPKKIEQLSWAGGARSI